MENYDCKSLLPYDGEAIYHGKIWSQLDANDIFNRLLQEIPWQNDEVVMFGKKMVLSRKIAWYGDPNTAYTYAKVTKSPLEWNHILLALKAKTEEVCQTTYNSCLLNLYHNGNESMGWHADNEKEIEPLSSIASLSFGAERKFSFKHKLSKETFSIFLENGSVLDMKNEIQQKWLHCLPKSKKVSLPRINLTFRNIIIPK